ncbi:MAG: patatin-like phospholipase family protein [Treponema sp.]|nr:patatin-like phospholipase family protein [Treponema sp.]
MMLKVRLLRSLRANLVRILFLLSLPVSALSTAGAEPLGLVLAGGGGKGAYQVGVWKALSEYGIAQRVTVISGTSVGALNGVLFSCVSPAGAERIWLEEVPGRLTRDALISQGGLQEVIDMVPVRDILGSWPRVCATTVRKRWIVGTLINYMLSSVGSEATRIWLNDESEPQWVVQGLLASSAFPGICPAVRLKDGEEYVDGGWEAVGGDNVPIDPLVEKHQDIRNIFVVYCDEHPARRVKVKDYDWLKVTELIPSIDTAGLFDGTTNFTRNRIRLLIDTGYEDTVALLKNRGLYPVSSYWFE